MDPRKKLSFLVSSYRDSQELTHKTFHAQNVAACSSQRSKYGRQVLCRSEAKDWTHRTLPTFILPYKCDGCGACIKICPSDILHLDPKTRKAYNIEPEMCWECLPCVKVCPQEAIEVRGYLDFIPMNQRVFCKRDEKANTITWTIKYRNDSVKKFTFPIRTTQWGSIKPPQHEPVPNPNDLRGPLLAHEPNYLWVKELPRPKSLNYR